MDQYTGEGYTMKAIPETRRPHQVSQLRQVCGFLVEFRFPTPIKLKYCWKWR